jgi:hypothetical protein
MRFKLIILLLALAGCKSDPPPAAAVAGSPQAPPPPAFISAIDHLRLRETPGADGKVVATLSEGDTLFALGEVSAFTTQVALRGVSYDEPWVKMRARDSLEGWVFAGGLNFSLAGDHELPLRLMRIRLNSFFGEELAGQILDYRQSWLKASADEQLAAAYREGARLQEALARIIEKRISLLQSSAQAPNLDWMKESLPGLLPQRVAEGTALYLFFDYRQWMEKSRKTSGTEDNQFFDVCLTAFALDSVEYFLPDWIIATSDEHSYSELGKGVHQKMLSKMNQAMGEASNGLFETQYQRFKTQLINDISDPEQQYWNDREAILRELDAILEADYGLLTAAEKTALRERRKQFEQPELHGIRLNFRAG